MEGNKKNGTENGYKFAKGPRGFNNQERARERGYDSRRYNRPYNRGNDFSNGDHRIQNRRFKPYRYDKYDDSKVNENDRYYERHGRGNHGASSRNSERTAYNRDESNNNQAPNEGLIAEYEVKLEKLKSQVNAEAETVIDSQWGIKPKGFEKISAQRAKISGLFPLPGQPRTVDFLKLEGEEREKLFNSNEILNEISRTDPKDSQSACTIIVSDIDFEKIDVSKLTQYFNDYLMSIDTEFVSLKNIERRKLLDHKLLLEFKNNSCATVVLALNGTFVDYKLIAKRQPEANFASDPKIQLKLARPNEYLVQRFTRVENEERQEIETDALTKVTIILNNDIVESELSAQLETINSLNSMKILREKGTQNSKRIALVNFKIPRLSKEDTISQVKNLISQIKQFSTVSDAFFSVIIPSFTSVQECETNFTNLKELAKNINVEPHRKSKVVQLINVVTVTDLLDKEKFDFIEKDIYAELSNYGKIKSLKIPRPPNDFTADLMQLSENGVGRIYVEFDEEEDALNAIMGIAGKTYNNRTVICAFFDHEDYSNGIL